MKKKYVTIVSKEYVLSVEEVARAIKNYMDDRMEILGSDTKITINTDGTCKIVTILNKEVGKR